VLETLLDAAAATTAHNVTINMVDLMNKRDPDGETALNQAIIHKMVDQVGLMNIFGILLLLLHASRYDSCSTMGQACRPDGTSFLLQLPTTISDIALRPR
jgi:hypothetical protein